LADNSVPASGAVAITAIGPRLISSSDKHNEIEGSLAGRPGKLTRDAADVYVFTPAPAEASTPAPPNSVFAPDARDAKDCILILWAGQNNIPAVAKILADTDAIVAPYARRHKRFLVIGMLNVENEPVGAPTFRLKMQVNGALAQRYGADYIDIRSYLVERGLRDLNLVADADDLEDIAKGVVPRKLRRDFLHPNENGNRLIARYLAATIRDRQW
jgi:hypothetical protein